MEPITDKYGRKIDYMRISVTDRCNLRCVYCNPDNSTNKSDILTFKEIAEVCRQASCLGINKIKLTGGEPLLRENCDRLVKIIKDIEGIEQVTLTTNGVFLANYAEKLYNSGIDGINISLDTVDPDKYSNITGCDCLDNVLRGIDEACKYNIPLKINTVITDIPDYNVVSLAKDRDISVRFIEMMPIGCGKNFSVYSNNDVMKEISERYGELKKDNSKKGNGPASYYRIQNFKGSIGFIGAIHNKFCNSCNRIRMTAEGRIKNCLCYESTYSVKESLRQGDYIKVREIIADAIYNKPLSHSFDTYALITECNKMSEIGG